MDLSCHGVLRGNHVGLGEFRTVVLSEIWADREKKVCKKGISTQVEVQK